MDDCRRHSEEIYSALESIKSKQLQMKPKLLSEESVFRDLIFAYRFKKSIIRFQLRASSISTNWSELACDDA